MRGFWLYIGARVLCTIFTPIGLFIACRKAVKQYGWREGWKVIDEKFMKMAIGKDIYGGVVCAEWFNRALIRQDAPLKFADRWITISEVLGVNARHRKLTMTGKRLKNLLGVFEPGHIRKASADN